MTLGLKWPTTLLRFNNSSVLKRTQIIRGKKDADVMFESILLGGSIGAFLLWLMKRKFNEIDDLDTRVTRIETKLDVLGDISKSLHSVSTDVEVIKNKVENLKEDLDEYNR